MQASLSAQQIGAQVPLVSRVVRQVCHLARVPWQDRDGFRSFVLLKLLEKDCRILRLHRGEGSTSSYLRTVVRRLLLDYRIQRWGKWRASAKATRLGTTAIKLERLTERDGYSRWEAIRHLLFNEGTSQSDLELLDLAEQLPNRARRRFENEDALTELPSPQGGSGDTESCVAREVTGLVRAGLNRALAELGLEDRKLLDLRYVEGLTVAEIARRTGERQRQLYQRFDRILCRLRKRLIELGVGEDSVSWLLARV